MPGIGLVIRNITFEMVRNQKRFVRYNFTNDRGAKEIIFLVESRIIIV